MTLKTIKQGFLKKYHDFFSNPIPQYPTLIKYFHLHRIKNNYKADSQNIFNRFDKKSSFIIHIPKTAGTSVYKSIYGTDISYSHFNWKDLRIIMKDKKFSDYFSFSIVRNPWDRCLSAYEFLRSGGDNLKDRRFNKNFLSNFSSFEDFVKNGLSKRKIINWIHFIPQTNFTYSENDKCMVDYILRFENIENDYAQIKKKLEGSSLLKYNVNRTNDNYQKHYDEEMKNIIYKVYSRDIRLLKYEF
tara:strand:- start:778 stop:1509 length:732 start_codon:yes stop_codon:yes gene_type:complete